MCNARQGRLGIMNGMDKKILRMVAIAIFILGAIYAIVALWMAHH